MIVLVKRKVCCKDMSEKVEQKLQKILDLRKSRMNAERELSELSQKDDRGEDSKATQEKKELLSLQINRYFELEEIEFDDLLQNILIGDEIVINKKEKIIQIKKESKEIEILFKKISRILQLLDDTKQLLCSAGRYSIWDILGGGMFSDAIKNEKLDRVQEMIKTLNLLIHEVEGEMGKLMVDTDIQINSNGLLRFSDYIFDDIFSAIHIKKKIRETLLKIQNAKQTFIGVKKNLADKKRDVENRLEELKDEYYAILLEIYK